MKRGSCPLECTEPGSPCGWKEMGHCCWGLLGVLLAKPQARPGRPHITPPGCIVHVPIMISCVASCQLVVHFLPGMCLLAEILTCVQSVSVSDEFGDVSAVGRHAQSVLRDLLRMPAHLRAVRQHMKAQPHALCDGSVFGLSLSLNGGERVWSGVVFLRLRLQLPSSPLSGCTFRGSHLLGCLKPAGCYGVSSIPTADCSFS
jgi:hypothetical protein